MVWSFDHNFGVYLIVAAGLVALLAFDFGFGATRNARSEALAALRLMALATLLLILLNPSREEHQIRPGPQPTAVFLIDESRSMSLESPTSRSQAAQQLINRAAALVPTAKAQAIEKFGFGRELFATPAPVEARAALVNETRLGHVLRQLPARFSDTLPFGVVIFSDGRSTEPESLAATAQGFRELGVPVHVVPLGDERISGDVAIASIDAPRDARPGTRVPVKVIVRSQGHAGQRTELRIRHDTGPNGDVLSTLPMTLTDGERDYELVIAADRAKSPLVVEVSPLKNEAIVENNRVSFEIGQRDSKIRVIYMEGSANEYKWLRDALLEDPKIECLAIEPDDQFNVTQRLRRVNDRARGYPTTREELFGYDLVICSDISRGAFTQEQLDWTVELVGQRGGGFAMVGGYTSFGAGRWDQTVWDGMIPVDMSDTPGGPQGTHNNITMQVEVPPEAEHHPIWHFSDDPARNRQILTSMPLFYGTNLTDRLKPGASVLGLGSITARGVELPPRGVAHERPRRVATPNGEPPLPVFSCQSFGKGRTFAFSSDTTFGWGCDFEEFWGEGDNRYFRQFWRNVVYWLTENRRGSNRRLEIETDKVFYRPGQPIEVTARAYDHEHLETDAYRVVARLRNPDESDSQPFDDTATPLLTRLGHPAYRGKVMPAPSNKILQNPRTAVYQLLLDVAAYDGEAVEAQSSVAIQVVDDPAEFRDPRPDPAQLEQLARATAGRVIRSPEELAAVLASHPEPAAVDIVTRSPLWDQPLPWLILIGLLSAEWILRRLRGLA